MNLNLIIIYLTSALRLLALLQFPKVALGLERLQLSTAALRFARCITHRVRSQPRPTSHARRAHNPKVAD